MHKLLLAEDEEVLRMLVVDTLEDEGYEVDEAEDGEEAFEKIKETDYDLVMIDYMMPGMTGIEVIEKIRNELNNQELKILMLTAKSQQADKDRAKEAGANYFLAKPFSPLKLVDLVQEVLD